VNPDYFAHNGESQASSTTNSSVFRHPFSKWVIWQGIVDRQSIVFNSYDSVVLFQHDTHAYAWVRDQMFFEFSAGVEKKLVDGAD